jgi:hypothetical protein
MLAPWNTRAVVLAGGVLVAGLGLVGPASAKPKEPQGVSNNELVAGLQMLHATKLTLEGADHDYGGHRAAAVKAIGAAEHQLRKALHAHGPKGHAGRPAGGGEAQAVSNIQLAESIAVLGKTIAVLQAANHDYGGHRAAAVKDLQVAVQQLKLALQFEKKREIKRATK